MKMLNELQVVIPMAGAGTRMAAGGEQTPKPLVSVAGKTLIEWAVESLDLSGRYIFVARKYSEKKYRDLLDKTLSKLTVDFDLVLTQQETSGAAETALLAKSKLRVENPLVVTNSDQYLDWNPSIFIEHISRLDPDGSLGLFKSNNLANSFARVNGKRVTEVREKQQISNLALTGFHYWKKAGTFSRCAEKLLNDFDRNVHKETFISLVYNYQIEEKDFVSYFEHDGLHQLGTPNQLIEFRNWKEELGDHR